MVPGFYLKYAIFNVKLGKIRPPYLYGLEKTCLQPKFHTFISKNKKSGQQCTFQKVWKIAPINPYSILTGQVMVKWLTYQVLRMNVLWLANVYRHMLKVYLCFCLISHLQRSTSNFIDRKAHGKQNCCQTKQNHCKKNKGLIN